MGLGHTHTPLGMTGDMHGNSLHGPHEFLVVNAGRNQAPLIQGYAEEDFRDI